MRLSTTALPLFICLTISICVNAQSRRIRVRPRPIIQQESDERIDDDVSDEENTPSPALQYFSAAPRSPSGGQNRYVIVSSDDDYNGEYGQQTSPPPRARVDYSRQIAKSTTLAPRTKDPGTKPPPVQTIRNYSKVNDDGSFTFGYEAADGSFKEETRGTDCVVRGKYGYVDPDGNKREFTYVSGNPCDPNNPDETEEEPDRSQEDSNEPENVPQNYPQQRPVRPLQQHQQKQQYRPTAYTTTTHAPTTVFQNTYSSSTYRDETDDDEEQPEPIQLLHQPQQRPQVTQRPQIIQQQNYKHQSRVPEEVTIRQRPRITVVNTTPTPTSYQTPSRQTHPVSITPRPTFRITQPPPQTQPPATTYRPAVQFITQKSASPLSVYNSPTPSLLSVEPITKNSYSSPRKPIDFAGEFKKFQQEHNTVQSTTTARASTQKPFKPSQVIQNQKIENPASNPIYESQLVFDPSTGQYDSALYQQLPQSDGDFTLNHRIQPYVHQPHQFHHQAPPPQQIINLEQPIYQRPGGPQPTRSPLQFPAFSQQIYHKEQENHQVANSQQLFAHQQELQQQQLLQDRLEAAKRLQQQQNHRFQVQQPQQHHQQQLQQQPPQGYYFVQPQIPQQSTGQIDAFLRGHNLDF